MLRASGGSPDNPLIIVGISEGNVRRLKNSQPIYAPIKSFGMNLPGSILIFYGETETEMENQLRHMGVIGDSSVIARDPRVEQEASIRAQHRHILIATVGLPRSGKTTWAKNQAYPIVNPDSIRLAIHGQRYISQAEPFVWATAKAMVRALFLAGHQIVVLDAVNNTRKRRDEWISEDWETFYKVIDTPAETCLQRASAENDTEIASTIERMAGQHEPLGEGELIWP